MSTKKISELPVSATLTGAELMEVSQTSGGVYGSYQTTTAEVSYAAAQYGSFYDNTDQSGSTSAATAVKLTSNDITGHGISVVTDGSALTRITYAAAGTYMIAPSLQFANSDTTNHTVNIWLAKNGTNLASSNTVISVPKVADGGNTFFQIVYYVTLAAGDYLQIKWLPTSALVTLDAIPAGAIAPAAPSVILATERIGL